MRSSDAARMSICDSLLKLYFRACLIIQAAVLVMSHYCLTSSVLSVMNFRITIKNRLEMVNAPPPPPPPPPNTHPHMVIMGYLIVCSIVPFLKNSLMGAHSIY